MSMHVGDRIVVMHSVTFARDSVFGVANGGKPRCYGCVVGYPLSAVSDLRLRGDVLNTMTVLSIALLAGLAGWYIAKNHGCDVCWN
ncbi:MAG: hypothetical protein ACREL5_04175 [Gemmatimonadales bacterium]